MSTFDIDSPSRQLTEGIMSRVNALGNQPRVIIELDKMEYVRGFRQKYDAVQYVYDSTVGELLSIDNATKLTNHIDGVYGNYGEPLGSDEYPTGLRNLDMSMPLLKSSTMHGKKNDARHINGIYITDWFDTDPRCSRKVHKGIDLDCAKGDILHAVWSGVVRVAGAVKGYGQAVYIDHGNGWSTRYGHMKPGGMMVSPGDRVRAGDPIGIGWNSGTTSSKSGDGSHIHFEVRHNEVPLNPEPFLRKQKTIQVPRKTPNPTPVKSSTAFAAPTNTGSYVEYEMEATAYVATCSGCTGITKGGTDVRKWNNWKIIAVDPSVIPLKSKVELIVGGKSWGEYLADDIGGDIKGNRIDILMRTNAECIKFGRKGVTVRVTHWGDGRKRTTEEQVDYEIVTYQVNKTTQKVSYNRDFSSVRKALDSKFTGMVGTEQFMSPIDAKQFANIVGFKGTVGPGAVKKFSFTHEWFKPGNLGWGYISHLMVDDVVQVKVDGTPVVIIKGIDAKSGLAYPPSIPIPSGKHTIEFSLANPSRASQGTFGITFLKAREFDVETEERKAVWDFVDTMSSVKNWAEFGKVNVKDGGDYQIISSTSGTEAGIERLNKFKSLPITVRAKVKVDKDTKGAKIYIGSKGRVFVVNIDPDSVRTNGGKMAVNNTQWQQYVIVIHDETDMDVYLQKGNTYVNTGVRGVGASYTVDRLLFAVTQGKMYIDNVNYATRDYTIEQLASLLNDTYKEKWYEVGSYQFVETLTIEDDVMNWEVNHHLDMTSSTATVTLNNHKGAYSPDYTRMGLFPEAKEKSPFSYYDEGILQHVISEYTPVRIYAGYGDDVTRVFTGLIKGEIEEDSESRTLTFHCVDRYDVLEEFVFYKDFSYPPEEAYAGDGGAFAWIKSAIVEDIVREAGMTGWRVVQDDRMYPDYLIEDTTYIDVNKGKNTFMRFDKDGELVAVTEEAYKTQGGWKNPFVTAVTFKVGTRASDAINSLLQDLPYRAYCDRYGTFKLKRMDFLDTPDWQIEETARWEFIDGDNLFSLTSSTDHSRVRNHLMVSGSSGLVEHFFDKELIMATKGYIRTAGLQMPWIEEKDGATMRGQKQDVANKVFFDMQRQARTKNVVVKGNPLIELLDSCYVYDASTFTAGYYLVKGNRIVGNEQGIVNFLELTWKTLTD